MSKQDLILIALSQSSVADLMQRTLQAAGFEVTVAHDRHGLDKAVQEAIPSLIIISGMFDGQDGFRISQGLLERFPTLPIILYADRDTTGMAKSVIQYGLSGYLYPPLQMRDIIDEIHNSLARARKLGDWLRREVRRTTSSLAEKAKISEAERVKLEAIISNIQDGVIVMDEDQCILLVNRTIREVFNLTDTNINGRPISDLIANADLKSLLSRSGETPLKYHEINFDDGKVFNSQYTPIPKIGSAVTMQDISYLKELDRLKSDFVHTVSHDLRSPLTAVLGYAELIERMGPLSENQSEFLHRLQGSVQHITNLINELLDLERLEAGFDTRREIIQLEDVLKYTLDMFETQVKKKSLELAVDVPSHTLPLLANPIRIRQMLDNLVGNAIKYTPSEGHIHVSISMQEKQVVFEIQDTGPGISQEDQNRVFEKFYRATTAPEGVSGSGLGLAIVKSIVDSHQGRVWVESTVGKGSKFVVLLPGYE